MDNMENKENMEVTELEPTEEITAVEAAEEVAEETEVIEEVAAEAEEAVEEAAEDAAEETADAAEATAAEQAAMKASTAAKREKKAARRDAKAARKEANKVEEKKSRPNNLLLAIMIFGVLILMFVAVKGYNYFSLDKSIEEYVANNGGDEQYSNMMVDQFTTATLTAEGNSMKIALDTTVDEEQLDTYKEFYSNEDWEKQMKYIGSYFLTTMKPNVRGFSGDVTVSSNVNGEEIKSVSLTYKEAKDFMKEMEEEAKEEAEEHDHEDADEADADEAAEGDDAEEAEESEGE